MQVSKHRHFKIFALQSQRQKIKVFVSVVYKQVLAKIKTAEQKHKFSVNFLAEIHISIYKLQ